MKEHLYSSGRIVAAALLFVIAGLAASTASATGRYATVQQCPAYSMGQPFLPWLDPGSYFLAPGGSFESGTSGWTFRGGASVVSGNESYHVNGASDSRSLALPSGSSATSSSVCVTLLSPDARVFVRNTGSLLSLLRVDLNYTDANGRSQTATVGLLPGGSSWSLSLPVLFLLGSIKPIVGSGGQTWVSFTFVPTGSAGKWQIDDFYVDPLKNH
jgi:hypothetical protein